MNQKEIKQITDGILTYLRNNNLEDSLPQIIEELKSAEKGFPGYVYSPKELSDVEKVKTMDLIRNLAGELPKDIFYEVDETLLDGLKISYKDKMWDFTLKGQVDKLKN